MAEIKELRTVRPFKPFFQKRRDDPLKPSKSRGVACISQFLDVWGRSSGRRLFRVAESFVLQLLPPLFLAKHREGVEDARLLTWVSWASYRTRCTT